MDTLLYSPANQLRQVTLTDCSNTTTITTFVYDGRGERVKQVANNVATVYGGK